MDDNYSNEGRNSVPQTTSTTSDPATAIELQTVTVTGHRPQPSMKVMIRGNGAIVRFEATAPISESRVANYEGFNIVHLPTSLWAYRNTNGRHFSVSGKLVSRTPNEATANAGYLTTVRSWLLPDFGNSGAPPPLVFLSGYSNNQITEVPCIVLSYNWNFPEDVDYIWGTAEPMPVIGVLSIELEEAYSAEQITGQEWMISPQSGGSFSQSGAPGSASSTGPGAQPATFGMGWKGIAASNAGSFPTIGNMLATTGQSSPDSIALNPTTPSSIISNAANSPEITSAVISNSSANSAIFTVVNQWVSGSSPLQILRNSVNSIIPGIPPITNPILKVVANGVDNYARKNGLAIPSFPKL